MVVIKKRAVNRHRTLHIWEKRAIIIIVGMSIALRTALSAVFLFPILRAGYRMPLTNVTCGVLSYLSVSTTPQRVRGAKSYW